VQLIFNCHWLICVRGEGLTDWVNYRMSSQKGCIHQLQKLFLKNTF